MLFLRMMDTPLKPIYWIMPCKRNMENFGVQLSMSYALEKWSVIDFLLVTERPDNWISVLTVWPYMEQRCFKNCLSLCVWQIVQMIVCWHKNSCRVFNCDWLILNWCCAFHSQYYDFFFFSSCSILFDVLCIKISRVLIKYFVCYSNFK